MEKNIIKKHVVVLMGGISSEREVSLNSGKQCAKALEALGYQVTLLDVTEDVMARLLDLKCDMVFNALHGSYGEDGCIQGVLEFLKLPYTHSGVLASALAMDKQKAKEIVERVGVPIVPSRVINRFDLQLKHLMTPPYVIKPVREGSSFGVFLVKEGDEVPIDAILHKDWPYGDELMLEPYISGSELTCAVMGDRALAVCEIVVEDNSTFYDYSAKYKIGGSKHLCPAQISSNIYQNVQNYSLLAHKALGCRGVTRSDFRYDRDRDQLIWLELNTQPGMTKTSLVPDVARYEGLSFESLVKYMVEDASCRR